MRRKKPLPPAPKPDPKAERDMHHIKRRAETTMRVHDRGKT
jgi:hypothetical protein